MLSESRERMLIVVHKGREEEVKRIFDKWDLRGPDRHHHRHRPHEGAPAVNSSWIFPRGKSPMSPVYQREAVEPAYLKMSARSVSMASPTPQP
jgi:phosphoribosylformylglycinamidine synthase